MEPMLNRRFLPENSLLKKELDLFRLLVSTTAQGVCLVSTKDAKILYVNSNCEKIFGYGPNELVGNPVNILHSEKNISDTMSDLTEQVNKFGNGGIEVLNKHKSGKTVWCLTHAIEFDYPELGPVWCVLYEDITLDKRIQNILGEQNLKSFSRRDS